MTKVVLITGGTRGIGRALVDIYLRHGFAVATCSSNPENTRQLREAYPDEKKLYVATFDIQDAQAGRQFVKAVLDRWERFSSITLIVVSVRINHLAR